MHGPSCHSHTDTEILDVVVRENGLSCAKGTSVEDHIQIPDSARIPSMHACLRDSGLERERPKTQLVEGTGKGL